LDKAAWEHDVAYSKYKDTETRHNHNNILAQKAVNITATTTGQQERKDAKYVAGVMAAKQRIGLGIKHRLIKIV
jgi:hypothetical protein